jgi:hypothetical protein
MGTSPHHQAADVRATIAWAIRVELFLRHLAFVVGLLPQPRADINREALLEGLWVWLLGFMRGGAGRQRDTIPDDTADALRAELDRQTEIASRVVDLSMEVEGARSTLAHLHDVEAAAFSLNDLVVRTIGTIAVRDRARTILAEQDAAKYRAEAQSLTREVATLRERHEQELRGYRTAIQWLADGVKTPPTIDRSDWFAWIVSHVRDCENVIDECRAAFGKRPMGANDAEYIDLASEVRSAVAAKQALAEMRAKVEAFNSLGDDLRARGGLIPLPKPATVEAGQRWARFADVIKAVGGSADVCGGWWQAEGMLTESHWTYLGLTPKE